MSTWYYYDKNGQKQGPVSGGQLKGLAKAGRITPETTIENEEGKTALARKVKGLTFGETAQPIKTPTPPPVETDLFSAFTTADLDMFSATMSSVNQAPPQRVSVPIATKKNSVPLVAGVGVLILFIVVGIGWAFFSQNRNANSTSKLTSTQQSELDKYIKQYKNDALVYYLYDVKKDKNPPDRNLVFEYVKYFVSNRADVNGKDGAGNTPLHFAVDRKDVEFVQFLVSKGAKVNVKNKSNFTPLTVALASRPLRPFAPNVIEIVQLLVSEGADVNDYIPYSIPCMMTGGNTYHELLRPSLLHMAADGNDVDLAKLLVSHGADVNVTKECDLQSRGNNDRLTLTYPACQC